MSEHLSAANARLELARLTPKHSFAVSVMYWTAEGKHYNDCSISVLPGFDGSGCQRFTPKRQYPSSTNFAPLVKRVKKAYNATLPSFAKKGIDDKAFTPGF